jgi:hypothetical protein
MHTVEAHTDYVKAVACCGDTLVSAGLDNKMVFTDIASGKFGSVVTDAQAEVLLTKNHPFLLFSGPVRFQLSVSVWSRNC